MAPQFVRSSSAGTLRTNMSRLFNFNEFSGLKEINAAKSAIYHDTVCPISSKNVPRTESAPGTHNR